MMKHRNDRRAGLALAALWLALEAAFPGSAAAQGPAAPAARTDTSAAREDDPDKGIGGTGVTGLPAARPDPVPELPAPPPGPGGGLGILTTPDAPPPPEPPTIVTPPPEPPKLEPPPVVTPPVVETPPAPTPGR